MLTAIIIEQVGVFIHDATATSACRVTSCARIDLCQGKIIPDTSNMSFGHAGLPGDVSCDTEVARPRKLCTTSHLDFIMSVWERTIWSSLFCKSLFRPQPRIHMPRDATHSSSDFSKADLHRFLCIKSPDVENSRNPIGCSWQRSVSRTSVIGSGSIRAHRRSLYLD